MRLPSWKPLTWGYPHPPWCPQMWPNAQKASTWGAGLPAPPGDVSALLPRPHGPDPSQTRLLSCRLWPFWDFWARAPSSPVDTGAPSLTSPCCAHKALGGQTAARGAQG